MESLSFLRDNETFDDFYNRCNNLSLFDCSEEEMLWLMMGSRRLPLSEIVPWSVLLVVIFLTGVVGNVCVCVVIVRNPGLHTATNYYLFSLAVSDLLLLLFDDIVEPLSCESDHSPTAVQITSILLLLLFAYF